MWLCERWARDTSVITDRVLVLQIRTTNIYSAGLPLSCSLSAYWSLSSWLDYCVKIQTSKHLFYSFVNVWSFKLLTSWRAMTQVCELAISIWSFPRTTGWISLILSVGFPQRSLLILGVHKSLRSLCPRVNKLSVKPSVSPQLSCAASSRAVSPLVVPGDFSQPASPFVCLNNSAAKHKLALRQKAKRKPASVRWKALLWIHTNTPITLNWSLRLITVWVLLYRFCVLW